MGVDRGAYIGVYTGVHIGVHPDRAGGPDSSLAGGLSLGVTRANPLK